LDKKKIKVPLPKTRRSWKIKPFTRVKPSDKTYHRRRQKARDRELLQEAVGDLSPHPEKPSSKFRFCPHCGGPLVHKEMGDRKRLFCSSCGFVLYRNPVPAVGVIIPRGGKIVLVRRAEEPLCGHWCLPAGFMELDETPQECAIREAKEETGLDIQIKELFGVYAGQDDPRVRVVLIIYLAQMVGGDLRAGDDASEVELFGPDELPQNVAFATHRRAIAEYFEGAR
jgi:ADP-ribose pyrophosphatase YjhB (NUDIX family)